MGEEEGAEGGRAAELCEQRHSSWVSLNLVSAGKEMV